MDFVELKRPWDLTHVLEDLLPLTAQPMDLTRRLAYGGVRSV